MDRLDAARMQLSTALDALANRMQEAAAQRAATMEPMRDMAEAEAVRAERDRLLSRLRELEQESRALAGVTEDVEARLDGAIAEIREVLENAA
jgi:predicted  nucleic acid-binding Zn-ribbon protein